MAEASHDMINTGGLQHVQDSPHGGEEEGMIVAVEHVPMHEIEHPVQTVSSHDLAVPLQSGDVERGVLDMEADKKLKKQKKIHNPKKTISVDANGNPIDKRKAAALALAQDIVQRYRERGNVLPKEWIQRKGNPEREREYRDKNKLRKWRQSLNGNYKGNICFKEIKEYLDANMPGWSQGRQAKFRPSLETAQDIIERYYASGSVLPRVQSTVPSMVTGVTDPQNDQEQGSSSPAIEGTGLQHTRSQQLSENAIQESEDAECLSRWRQQYHRLTTRKKKSSNHDVASNNAINSVRELLDHHIPNWREPFVDYGDPNASIKTPRPRHNVDPMQKATEIVKRYKERGNVLPKEWHDLKGNPERMQEYKDASKLRKWRQAINGVKSVSTVCPDFLQEYLDQELGNWRHSSKSKSNNAGEGSDAGDKRYQKKRKRPNKDDSVHAHMNSQAQEHDHNSHVLLSEQHMDNNDRDSASFSEAARVLLSPSTSGLQLVSHDHHGDHMIGTHGHGETVQGVQVVGMTIEEQQQYHQHHQHNMQQHQHHQLMQQDQQRHLQDPQQHHHLHEQEIHHEQNQDDQDDDQDHDMTQLVEGLSSDMGPPSPTMLSDHDNIMSMASGDDNKDDDDLVYSAGHVDESGTEPNSSRRGRDTYEITDTVQI